MCRFMMVKSLEPIEPQPLLRRFAAASRASKAYDGDWQGDGWGIGYVANGTHPPAWYAERSTGPMWEETERFQDLPPARVFVAHARSASFARHKGVLAYSQPFIHEPFAFVFNGLVKGVSLPYPVKGDIGSQKIWTLLSGLLDDNPPQQALLLLRETLERHARTIQALNVGLCDRQHLYAYCHFTTYPQYYRLHRHDTPSLKILSSEPIADYAFDPVEPSEVIVL